MRGAVQAFHHLPLKRFPGVFACDPRGTAITLQMHGGDLSKSDMTFFSCRPFLVPDAQTSKWHSEFVQSHVAFVPRGSEKFPIPAQKNEDRRYLFVHAPRRLWHTTRNDYHYGGWE